MKRIEITLTLLLFTYTTLIKGQDNSVLADITALGLPVVQIDTNNAEEPTCDYVTAPEGAVGLSITNATKVPGRVILYRDGAPAYDSGEYEKGKSGITIKIRGNTSAWEDKKPYKLKLQKKADLLIRDDDIDHRDKNWILIKDGDKHIHTFVGLMVNELVGMPWTPAGEYVNVIINGTYRGLYMLMESVEQNSDCRIDVDKKTGYIIERDAYWWNEDRYIDTPHQYKFTYKYPDVEDVTDSLQEVVLNDLTLMEESLSSSYPHFIDVPSWVNWLLAHDILGTWDYGGSNIFIAKYDYKEESPLFMPCLWDFDSSMMMKDQWATIHNEEYFHDLTHSPNLLFAMTYFNRYKALRESLFDQVVNRLQTFKTDMATPLQQSRDKDKALWDSECGSVEENIDEYIDWFTQRKIWMDENVAQWETDGIEPIATVRPEQAPSVFYDMQGRRLQQPRRGFFISGGKVIFNRK